MPRSLGPSAASLDPLRDQVLVGTGHPAQFRYGLPQLHVFRALALGRSERDPGHLGQQVGAAFGDLPQLRRPGSLLGFGQGAPPSVPPGDAVQPGH